MGYTVSIGLAIKQKFESGDVVPHYTAIEGDICTTIVSCVGKAPADLEYDEPNGEMNYQFWKNLLTTTKGFKKLGTFIDKNKSQIIYLNHPEVKEIIAQIKKEIPTILVKSYYERAKWMVFWAEESFKRYGDVAAIGLF